jgi:hypothetical protein
VRGEYPERTDQEAAFGRVTAIARRKERGSGGRNAVQAVTVVQQDNLMSSAPHEQHSEKCINKTAFFKQFSQFPQKMRREQ